MEPLYDNNLGYHDVALRFSKRVRDILTQLIKEYPEYSALELLALINAAAVDAFATVSIERRLG